jgi:hypothetical protein
VTIRRLAPAIVLILLLPVAWVLGSRVDDVYEEPLTSEHRDRIPVPIELSYADYPMAGGTHAARTLLYLDDAGTLLRRDAIEVRVATFGTEPELSYDNNAVLTFERGEGCSAQPQDSPAGPLMLTVRFEGPGRVGVWTYRHEGGPPDPRTVYVRDPAWSEIGLMVELRGRWIERRGPSDYTRADLLSVMWEVRPGSGWIWGVVGVAALLMALGAAGLSARGAVIIAGSAFLLTFGLSLLYVVLVPPFQAPDEPSHFGWYAHLTEQPELHDAANLWGYRMHFMRIHSRALERFRPADVGKSHLESWDASPLGADRSSVTVQLWRAAAGWLRHFDVAGQLLALRILNAVVFSLAGAIGVILVCTLSRARRPAALIAILLLVPTLPFFAMHVSNYAQVIAAYVLIACCLVVIVLGGARAHWAGPPLGLGIAVAILCTRSAVPMLVPAGLLALSRIATPNGGWRPTLRRAGTFWSGVPIAAILLGFGVTDDYAARLLLETNQVSPAAAPVVSAVLRHPLLTGLAAWLALALLEGLVVTTGSGIAARLRAAARHIMRPIAWACCALMVANLTASAVSTLPHLTTATYTGETPTAYVIRALATLVTPFRLAGHDFQAATTFWGGFGWVNTLPPGWVVSVLTGGTAVAATALLTGAARREEAGLFYRVLLTGAGILLALAGYAAAGLWTPVVLHGRYLVGVYLAGLLVLWILALGPGTGRGRWLTCLAWTLAAVGHAVALVTIVTRYF